MKSDQLQDCFLSLGNFSAHTTDRYLFFNCNYQTKRTRVSNVCFSSTMWNLLRSENKLHPLVTLQNKI